MTIQIGATYEAPYPFKRVPWHEIDNEGAWNDVVAWAPGCDADTDNSGNVEYAAEGIGAVLLTVVDVHRPGKYPTRVFYIRQWRAPDGKVFGNTKLRITTQQTFKRLMKGYTHEYWLDGQKQNDRWAAYKEAA